MSYIKKTWVNDETYVSAENFNYIEEGIYENQNIELLAISESDPTSFTDGDKYYNTTDNKIYTASSGAWANGETPIRGAFYIVISEQSTYYYDGTTLVSVGGGTEDIYIQEEEPEDGKIWIDTDEVENIPSEVVNTLSGDETALAPSVHAVNEALAKGNCSISTYSSSDQTSTGTTTTVLSNSTSSITTKGGKVLVVASCNCYNTGAGYFFNVGIKIGDIVTTLVGSNQTSSNTLTGTKVIELEAGTYSTSLYIAGTDTNSAIKVPSFNGYSYSIIEI